MLDHSTEISLTFQKAERDPKSRHTRLAPEVGMPVYHVASTGPSIQGFLSIRLRTGSYRPSAGVFREIRGRFAGPGSSETRVGPGVASSRLGGGCGASEFSAFPPSDFVTSAMKPSKVKHRRAIERLSKICEPEETVPAARPQGCKELRDGRGL